MPYLEGKASNLFQFGQLQLPDAKDGEDDRKIGFEGGSAEVVVHPVGTGEQLDKVVVPDVQGNGHTDGRPQAVPEAKQGLRVQERF